MLNKNIIPIFLSGVYGFPNNLPKDIIGVVKKNGPEYNRYYFNDFYSELKKRFLRSKSTKIYTKYSLITIALITILTTGTMGVKSINEPSVIPADTSGNTDIITKNIKIDFYGKQKGSGFFYHELYAKVDGYHYKIEIEDEICFTILAQDDFDGDGITDALIENIQACGGNAVGNSFFFVSYNGNGYFSISNSFGNNVWEEPIIEIWKGEKSVVIIDTNEGLNKDKDNSIKERYILKQGDAIRVESSKKNSIVVLQEIRSSDFHNGKEQEVIRMRFDLDNNGIIECKYWERWDALNFEIILNGEYLDLSGTYGVSRIGIGAGITNGMHDLICSDDEIIKWDGNTYNFDDTIGK